MKVEAYRKMEDKEYFIITEIEGSVSKSDLFNAVQSRELVFSFFIPEALYIAVEPYSEWLVMKKYPKSLNIKPCL